MSKSSPDKSNAAMIDGREQPYNSRECGPIDRVQLCRDNITSLHGIVFDLDLNLFRPDGPAPLDLSSTRAFADRTLVPILSRHPALCGAEVRDTGRNVHAIAWFDHPVNFADDGDRRRWGGIVETVQAALPIDPDQPGLTVLTRPVGSINGKTGLPVATLRAGTPVMVSEILKLHGQMVRTPFRTVMGILFGSARLSPCPLCRAEGSSLAGLDFEGRCYGSCGKVKLHRLYDAFLARRALPTGEASNGNA